MRSGLNVVLSMGVKRRAAAAILVVLLLLGSLWLREYVSLNLYISVGFFWDYVLFNEFNLPALP